MIPETEKGKGPEYGRIVAVDRETGQFIPLQRVEQITPLLFDKEGNPIPAYDKEGKFKAQIFTPEKRLENYNDTQWRKRIADISFYKKEADEILSSAAPSLAPFFETINKKGVVNLSEQEKAMFAPAIDRVEKSGLFLENVKMEFTNLFEKAVKYSDPKDDDSQKVLRNISDQWTKFNQDLKERKKDLTHPEYVIRESELLDASLKMLGAIEGPNQFIKAEDFAKDKASETLSSVALHNFKKFKDKSPTICIENPPYGSAISSGKDLKELIETTQDKFVKKLIKENKISKSEAENIARKMIGATWDTSHISMIRRQGFGPEQIVKETKEVAKHIKHVHFNDNFGSTHTDLPPGMGDVPIKDVLDVLNENKFKGKKVFEGGNFVQNFQTSPFPYTLEYSGSPLYSASSLEPYWNQLGFFGNYFTGHGPINPPVHHSIYGAGFTTLPVDLGGEMPGSQSRFSGTPNQ
jgi:hypothetical protein